MSQDFFGGVHDPIIWFSLQTPAVTYSISTVLYAQAQSLGSFITATDLILPIKAAMGEFPWFAFDPKREQFLL